MTLPTLTVEFGFGQSIGTAYGSVTWTDVTDYVRASGGLAFGRGRAVVGQAPTAGTLSVALANDDGRFTPGRTGGPYGSGVKARIPVRVRATSGSTSDAWYGFVTDWEWTPGGEVRAEVRAADILAQAAKIRCKPWLTGRHLAQEPTFYWPLSDAAGSTTAAPGAGGINLALLPGGGALAAGVESDLDESTVVSLTQAGGTAAPTRLASARDLTAPSGVVAVSVWVKAESYVAPPDSGLLWIGPADVPAFQIYRHNSWGLIIRDGNVSAAYSRWALPSGYPFVPSWEWCHLYILRDNSASTYATRYRLWVDGVEYPFASESGTPGAWGAWASGGRATVSIGGGDSWDDGYTFDGQFAHFAIFDNPADPAGQAAYLADLGVDDVPAADRFADLDDVTPIPGAIASWLAADATALQSVSPQPTAARTLLEVAQDVATTERGALIAGRDGRLRLQSSRARLTETVGLTLDARTDVLTFDGAFGVDDADAVDEVTVTQKPSGATFTGRRTGGDSLESTGFDVWTPSATHAQSVADGAANYPADTPKAPNMTVSMERMGVAGLAGDVLALELGDLIRVTNLPSSAPNTTVDLVVEAISHAVDAGGWTVTFDTSPGPLAAGAVVGTTGALSTVATTLMVRN